MVLKISLLGHLLHREDTRNADVLLLDPAAGPFFRAEDANWPVFSRLSDNGFDLIVAVEALYLLLFRHLCVPTHLDEPLPA